MSRYGRGDVNLCKQEHGSANTNNTLDSSKEICHSILLMIRIDLSQLMMFVFNNAAVVDDYDVSMSIQSSYQIHVRANLMLQSAYNIDLSMII